MSVSAGSFSEKLPGGIKGKKIIGIKIKIKLQDILNIFKKKR